MLRTVASKVAWVGRTASMVFGLALVMALVLGATSVALAGNLDPLKIGSLKNVATKTTQLVGKVATGSAFAVNNPSGGSALGLQVNAGQAPMTVNPEAGKATNLDADELDGKDASEFAPSAHPHAGEDITSGTVADDRIAATVARDAEVMPTVQAGDGAGSNLDADKLDGKDSTEFLASGCRSGFSAFAGGRLCVSGMMGPAPLYGNGAYGNGAIATCKNMGARVGNSNDVMLTFTNPNFNYFGGVQYGWLADHFADNAWGTWNVLSPPSNQDFDGPPANAAMNSLPYRCVY